MAFDTSDAKPFLRLLSALVGLALLALSCAGFKHLSRTSGALEGQASFGCMCFLGVLFGALLFFGESKSEKFFFFFGFMRYRVGRSIVFALAGIMIAIIGKNMNDGCRCQSYVLLIIQGVACLACAALQLTALFFFDNNTSNAASLTPPAPANGASSPAPPVVPAEESSYVPPTPSKPTPKKSKRDESSAAPTTASRADDDNMPSWMRV